ncbi:hypothetical protein [Polaribacter sp.]|uniref:hypothetical protein n=1 Tax=Polaribacter sp. TaxID=1920175 RepID=UPI003EF56216
MRNLISSICLILSFYSCSLPTTKGLQQATISLPEFYNPYFSDTSIDYIYKAKIKAFDTNFGGILIIKKLENNNHRVVFTTDFGNKIFDFEIGQNSFKTNYLMAQLNKKIVVNTLRQDFETLTKEKNRIANSLKNDNFLVYKSKIKKRYNYYFLNTETNRLQKIIHTSKTKEKTIFSFLEIQNNIAKKIKIEHKNLPILINLEALNPF